MVRSEGSRVKRRRGAQPGNLNALKHGFYSKQFEPAEIQDLETRLLEGLQDEVAIIKANAMRIAINFFI